jgi:hypothetical protein
MIRNKHPGTATLTAVQTSVPYTVNTIRYFLMEKLEDQWKVLFAGLPTSAWQIVWVRGSDVDPNPVEPKHFAGSGVGSGINHFGSGSVQPLLKMNLKQNFSDKIHNFST